jgi:hypothetical protein
MPCSPQARTARITHVVAGLALLVHGCGDEPSCLEELTCAPSEAPTFEVLYDEVLRPSCALDGRSCHGPRGARPPSMIDVETARTELEAYVVPGEPLCSELVRRIVSDEGGFRMPPLQSARLSDEAICAIDAWVKELR